MPLPRLMTSAALLAALTAAAVAKPVTVTNETNLRKAPGTKSESITLMPKGTEVEVGECDAGWCKVTWNGQEGFAIARNLGMVVPGAPRQSQQADLSRLRRGYEQYFDNQGQTADQNAQPQPRQYYGNPQPPQYYGNSQPPQYYGNQQSPQYYGGQQVQPRPYYGDQQPQPRRYADRRAPQQPQYSDDDDDNTVIYGNAPGYVPIRPRGYYYGPQAYYGPRVYYGPGPYYYYRRW